MESGALKDQKNIFVNPLASKSIGRRTGKNVKAGKIIRKDAEGYENFEDYWSESDADLTRDSSSLQDDRSSTAQSQGMAGLPQNSQSASSGTAPPTAGVRLPSKKTTIGKEFFVNPLQKQIGHRTGKDIKAGKAIRRDDAGFENFDDYWSESDVSSVGNQTQSRGSLPSFVKTPHDEVGGAALARSHSQDGSEVPDVSNKSSSSAEASDSSSAAARTDRGTVEVCGSQNTITDSQESQPSSQSDSQSSQELTDTVKKRPMSSEEERRKNSAQSEETRSVTYRETNENDTSDIDDEVTELSSSLQTAESRESERTPVKALVNPRIAELRASERKRSRSPQRCSPHAEAQGSQGWTDASETSSASRRLAGRESQSCLSGKDGTDDVSEEATTADVSEHTDNKDASQMPGSVGVSEIVCAGGTEEEDSTESDEVVTADGSDRMITADRSEKVDTVSRSEELDTVSRSEELDTVSRSEELDTVGRCEELDTDGRSEELETVDRSEELERVDRSEELETVDRSEELETVDRSEELETVDRSEELDTGDRSEEQETVDRSEEPERVDRSEELERVDRSEELETVDRSEELETVDRSEELETVDRSEELETVDRSEELDTVSRSEELDTIGRSEELDTDGRSEELETVDRSEELDTTGRSEELDTVSRSEELDTVGRSDKEDTTDRPNEADTTDKPDKVNAVGRSEEQNIAGACEEVIAYEPKGTISAGAQDASVLNQGQKHSQRSLQELPQSSVSGVKGSQVDADSQTTPSGFMLASENLSRAQNEPEVSLTTNVTSEKAPSKVSKAKPDLASEHVGVRKSLQPMKRKSTKYSSSVDNSQKSVGQSGMTEGSESYAHSARNSEILSGDGTVSSFSGRPENVRLGNRTQTTFVKKPIHASQSDAAAAAKSIKSSKVKVLKSGSMADAKDGTGNAGNRTDGDLGGTRTISSFGSSVLSSINTGGDLDGSLIVNEEKSSRSDNTPLKSFGTRKRLSFSSVLEEKAERKSTTISRPNKSRTSSIPESVEEEEEPTDEALPVEGTQSHSAGNKVFLSLAHHDAQTAAAADSEDSLDFFIAMDDNDVGTNEKRTRRKHKKGLKEKASETRKQGLEKETTDLPDAINQRKAGKQQQGITMEEEVRKLNPKTGKRGKKSSKPGKKGRQPRRAETLKQGAVEEGCQELPDSVCLTEGRERSDPEGVRSENRKARAEGGAARTSSLPAPAAGKTRSRAGKSSQSTAESRAAVEKELEQNQEKEGKADAHAPGGENGVMTRQNSRRGPKRKISSPSTVGDRNEKNLLASVGGKKKKISSHPSGDGSAVINNEKNEVEECLSSQSDSGSDASDGKSSGQKHKKKTARHSSAKLQFYQGSRGRIKKAKQKAKATEKENSGEELSSTNDRGSLKRSRPNSSGINSRDGKSPITDDRGDGPLEDQLPTELTAVEDLGQCTQTQPAASSSIWELSSRESPSPVIRVKRRRRNSSAPASQLSTTGDELPATSVKGQKRSSTQPLCSLKKKKQSGPTPGKASQEVTKQKMVNPRPSVSAMITPRIGPQSAGHADVGNQSRWMRLPHVTPKSGVSFRRSYRHLPDVTGLSQDNSAMTSAECMGVPEETERPKVGSPRASTPFALTPCLARPGARGRRSKRRVTISDQVLPSAAADLGRPSVSGLDQRSEAGEESSMTDSVVHFCEMTCSSTPSIVRPSKAKIIYPQPAPEGLRRSKRTRVQGLEWYKNERIVYGLNKSGVFVESIEPSKEAEYLAMKKKKTAKRRLMHFIKKKRPKRRSSVSQNKSLHTAVPPDLNLVDSGPIPLVNPDNNEAVLIDCIAPNKAAVCLGPGLEPATAADPYFMNCGLRQRAFTSGCLVLRALAEKPTERVLSNCLVFVVQSGVVLITIHQTATLCSSGDQFFVPKGSTYSLKNMREEEAKLFYVQLLNDEAEEQGAQE